MSWDPARKSHQGLLEAHYRGPFPVDKDHPGICPFCNGKLLWYVTPRGKMQPFDEGTYEPHHGTCGTFAEFRKKQKAAESRGETVNYPD